MLQLESSTGQRTINLWNSESDRRSTQAETQVGSPYGFRADQAILTQLEAIDQFTITGTATGLRISNDPDYPDDPLTALGQYALELETFVDSFQGSGHTIHDDERGINVTGAIKSIGWQRDAGAKYELQWDLEFVRGNALMQSIDTTVGTANPTGTATLDGYDLGELSSWRLDKRQEVEPYKVAFANPGENLLKANSGAVRRFTIRGQQSDDGTDPDDRNTFDDAMRSRMGQNDLLTFEEPLTGRSIDVMLDSFESSREAGVTRVGEYNMELIQGGLVGT